MRRRRFCRECGEILPAFCIAFGCGLVCAIFFSLRFALLVAAILLICLGRGYRW